MKTKHLLLFLASMLVGIHAKAYDAPRGIGQSEIVTTGDGTRETPYNVHAALFLAGSLDADEPTEPVYIEGIISNNPSIDVSYAYGNATFKISDDGATDVEFYVYRTLDLGNKKFTNANKLKIGDRVVIYGPIVNFRGNTPETVAEKSYIVSINGVDEESNDDVDVISFNGPTVTITNPEAIAESESITVDLSTLGYENTNDVRSIMLSDGTTIVFDAGTNSNGPKYYDSTKGVRVYANNTITFNGKSRIAQIIMECDSYNGTDYVGNATATHTISGNSIFYTNASESAGIQLRVQKITIIYGEQNPNMVTIGNTGYATFCSSKALDFSKMSGLDAYVATEYIPSRAQVKLERVEDVPAYTGLVLIGTPGLYNLPIGTTETMKVNNMLVGVNATTVLNKNEKNYTNYVLADGSEGIGFYAIVNRTALAGGKSYLPLPTDELPAASGEAKGISFVFEDGGETAIMNLRGEESTSEDVYYNMNGQRISRPTHGIYIKNGKKVMVK